MKRMKGQERGAASRGALAEPAAPAQNDIGRSQDISTPGSTYFTGVNHSLPLGLTATRPLPGMVANGSTSPVNGSTRTTSRLARLA